MNVDEIVADVRVGLGLTENEVLVNIIVMAEYVDLRPDAYAPNRRRLAFVSSDELEPWTAIGMMEYGKMREERGLRDADEYEGDDA